MKYIIDVPEDRISAGRLRVLADMENSMTYWIETGIRVTPHEESSDTAEDAWKMVSHILKDTADGGMSWDDIEDCFGTNTISGIAEMSYAEVREKYDAWKKKKGEIKVGDEIYNNEYTERKGVIIFDLGDYCTFMEADGRVHVLDKSKACKTGRHFPEVAELLKKMREEE